MVAVLRTTPDEMLLSSSKDVAIVPKYKPFKDRSRSRQVENQVNELRQNLGLRFPSNFNRVSFLEPRFEQPFRATKVRNVNPH